MDRANIQKYGWGILSLLLVMLNSSLAGQTIYVDASATGGDDGSSWADAYVELQSALAEAEYGDQIRVAAGTYKPDYDPDSGTHTGDRGATFQLVNGVALYGGFPSGGGSWEDRDLNENETFLSGDLDDDDGPEFAHTDDNCYHVVTAVETEESTILDGFTITGGNANLAEEAYGGGLYCHRWQFHDATLVHCTFRHNQADKGGGIYGGSLTVIDCIFIGNVSQSSGGGWDSPSDALLVNCLFSGNRTGGAGGAIFCPCTSIEMINCTVTGNVAEGEYFYRGGGICGDDDTDMFLTNCIFWGNEGAEVSFGGDQPVVNYSCIQGGWPGEGNIDTDPLFVTPGYWDDNETSGDPHDDFWVEGDYHLKSQAGR